MSYDLTFFIPAAAPADPDDYVEWLEDVEQDDLPAPRTDLLRDVHARMLAQFPDLQEAVDDPRSAEYYFTVSTIQMAFTWSMAEEAGRAAPETARATGAGLELPSDGIMIRDSAAAGALLERGIDAWADIKGVIAI